MALFGLFGGRRREVSVYIGGRSRDAVLGMPIDEVYRTQPELQAVVSFLASSVAQLPLKCYLRETDEDRPRDTEGVLPRLLSSPGGGFTTYEVVLGTVSDLCLYGWALWWVLPSADAECGWELRVIPPMWVDNVKTVDGFTPSAYVINNPDTDGRQLTLPASQFVRFMTYNPGHPTVPLSPVEGLKQVLAERASSREYRNKVWLNGGWFSRYIERPAQDGEWGKEARERFAASIKHFFAGSDGVDSGGIPILEDGMKFVESRINAKEAEWAESMRLTREDVAAAYHVNPASVWSNEGQTYASVKDNARSLYVDTLGSILRLIQDGIKLRLVPMVEADPRSYAEFDLSAKLAGSFEEQASVLSQSVGGPWMTRNEARARQNMPAVEGGDELIVPLNVVEGGIASPHDTDPTKGAATVAGYIEGGVLYALPASQDAPSAASGNSQGGAKGQGGMETHSQTQRKSRGHPEDSESEAVAAALRAFVRRQRKKVLPSIDSAKDRGAADYKADDPGWWDGKRWDRELAADLVPILGEVVYRQAMEALASLGLDPEGFSRDRYEAYVLKMAELRAHAFNVVTLDQLLKAINGEATEGSEGDSPEGVFDKAADARAAVAAVSFATAAASFGTAEAVHQCVPDPEGAGVTKTWVVTSSNPRPSHAALNGETVPYDGRFSNGAEWPGDTASLTADETCGCRCEVEITIP